MPESKNVMVTVKKKPANYKGVVIHTRLTDAEAAELDSWRGSLDRAKFLRWLVIAERNRRNQA